GIPTLSSRKFRSLDFSGSHLAELHLEKCTFEDCIFDNCDCTNWGIWECRFSNCRFRSALLKKAVMGGDTEGIRNEYIDNDFTKADFRGSSWFAAKVERCLFADSRLDKVEFQSVEFVDCVFSGRLDATIFYRNGFEGAAYPPNEMKNVDLS